ncbi:MAG TPA: YtxH domain-containing protein [Pedobacter sp.]|nr:YtxH domain-containing protein [Pedobacter sp.]
MKSRNNSALIAIASLAGIAIGAALGILFAPQSGRNIRSKFSGSLSNRLDDDDLFKDHPVEELWEKARNHADQLQGPANKRKNTSTIKVPSAGTTAWKNNQVDV